MVDGEDAVPWGCDLAADAPLNLEGMPEIDAVGHRIVHGGARFDGPVRIDDEILEEIEALSELAPLHQPKSLRGLEAAAEALPGVPAVACFDTAFHRTLPLAAATYAVPPAWGIRRYGFHGLSHAWAARRAGARRTVTCHLGAGASLCAVLDGRSVDTTMGFTPLEGLVMATRSGSVDPGALLWLLERRGLQPRELAHALEHESGLLALAGTADMREIPPGSPAFEVYVHRLAAGVAAMTASLGGLDALVFTGGVGENSPSVRAAAGERLAFLGVRIDPSRNRDAAPDAEIGGGDVRVLVVAAREELEIARQARGLLGG